MARTEVLAIVVMPLTISITDGIAFPSKRALTGARRHVTIYT